MHIVPTRKPSMPPSRHQPQPRVRRIERGYTTMQPARVPTQRYLLASLWTPAHTAQAGTLSRLAQSAFINPNFAKLWWGQAISSVGDYAWDTALVLWVATFLAANQSWAPLAVSGVILAAAVPQIVAGPVAGVFVDRWDKRRTMIVTAGLQALVAALLILPIGGVPLPLLGTVRLPLFWRLGIAYADVSLLATFAQFFNPAQFALIKDIVPEPKQDQAIETSQAIQGLSVVLGPPLAAALVFGLGFEWALLLNALSFVVSFLAIFAIEAPPAASSISPGEAGHFIREFRDGMGYVASHTVLRTILVSEILTWLGFGALQSLGYFFITENLRAPASDYGLLGAVFGVGAIGGALLVTFFGQRIGLAHLLWVALVASGLFVTVMSHLTSLYPALVAAFLFGVSATAILVSASPLALHDTSREFVGRVMAVINPLGRLAALVSVVVAGFLVSEVLRGFHASILGITFDPVNAVFTGMGLLAVAGGIYARISLHDRIRTGGQQRLAPQVRIAANTDHDNRRTGLSA
ncbi:MAG TPA: MFS transporter [Ktedonobacterales bacterium]|nr:MFS transporter [Ktedonobacterales bacterium]